MAMQRLDVPAQGKKSRIGKKKREADRRGKNPKSQQFILSASMEIPLSSGEVVLTQGDGYNPLAWDNMPAALQKQFPHWKLSSPTAKISHEDGKAHPSPSKDSPTDEHPFLISASLKPQAPPEHGIPYVVMEGDTLNSISLKFDTTPAELARLNKRTLAGFSIFPGNVMYVPDGERSPTLAKREMPRKSAPPFLNYGSPTPERDAPARPPQPAPSNQNKANKKKLELTKSQELHPKVTVEVRPYRKRTVSSSARLENDCLSDWTNQDEATETHVSLSSKYISDDHGCVHGTLTVSTTSLIFKPNRSDPLVQEHGIDQYELLIPLDDITHASITRDVVPPLRQPFLSSRRQSSVRTQKSNNVAVDTQDSAMPPPEPEDTAAGKSRSDSEVVSEVEAEKSSESASATERVTLEVISGEKEEGSAISCLVDGSSDGGLERNPAPTMSDTDVESEREAERSATPIQLVSDVSILSEKGDQEEINGGKMDDEKSENPERETEVEDAKGETEERRDMQKSIEAELSSQPNDDDNVSGSNNPSNVNGELSSSADDLLAIMGSADLPQVRPHAISQCSVISLDAVLGDAAYFLHFRVVSKSGQRYTYVPVNTEKGVDIPPGVGKKASSPPVQCIKALFCFVIPERNLEKVVSFLSLHHPQGSARLGSPSDQQKWTDGHFDVIRGPRSDTEDLSFCDDHFKPDSWEVYSLSDLHMCRNVILRMEVEECLLLPHLLEESVLMTESHLRKLILHLPSQAVGHDMHLVYSTFRHGISLRTMYRNMLAFGDTPVLFIVRDDSNKLFGAVASSYLRLSDHFYGTGESFLFSFDDRGELEVFPWTGLNSYFIKGNTDSIAIGSGDGHFGLWLDENFLHGSSYNCETYGNQPLATTEDFLCTGVEAWGFGSKN